MSKLSETFESFWTDRDNDERASPKDTAHKLFKGKQREQVLALCQIAFIRGVRDGSELDPEHVGQLMEEFLAEK